MIFIIDKLAVMAALMLCILLLRIVWKIHFKSKKSIGFLLLLASFMILLQIVFGPGERGALIPLKWDGFILGLVIACRLAAMMFFLPIFTETTSAYSIATGIVALGINYRAAFVITTAFNMIPGFVEEGRAIIDAQKLRGICFFDKGSLFKRMKAYSALVVPLILNAMRKAQISSVSMDSRAFGVYKTRTWLEKPSMKVHDYLCIAVFLIFSFIAIFVNFWLN
jgi:energy-coupling factor transport system permease protein